MIQYSFHIDSFSTIVFTCNSFATKCYLRCFSVLISSKIAVRRNRFMPSLKVIWFSFNGFSKQVYALNHSSRRNDNRARGLNYPLKRPLNFPTMGLTSPLKRLNYPLKRLTYPPKRLTCPPKRLSCTGFPYKRLI